MVYYCVVSKNDKKNDGPAPSSRHASRSSVGGGDVLEEGSTLLRLLRHGRVVRSELASAGVGCVRLLDEVDEDPQQP